MLRSCSLTRSGPTGARRFSALALLLLVACDTARPGVGTEAISGATVIDVVSGRTIAQGVILIRDGHIVAIGSSADVPVPRGATVTDVTGRWIIPGLIDSHTHLQPWGLGLALHWGVTAVRDLHDGFPLADTLRAIAARTPSPRLFQAVAMLDGTPTTYPDAIGLASADDADAAVASVAARGATWVKVYSHTTPTLLAAVITAARARNLPVAAHLGLTDALTAARLGVTSIEHLTGIPEAAGDSVALMAAHARGFFVGWTAFEESWTGLDTASLGTVARTLAGLGVTLVPTLGLHETFSRLDDSSLFRANELADVPDSARANWNVVGMIKRAGWVREDYPAFRASRAVQDFFVHSFALAGGRIATGTDASNQLLVPGAGVHLEMELLVRAGLTPLDALRAGTLRGAELLRADSLGSLHVGGVADLVVLGGNPLAEIRNSRQVVKVMLGGKWVR
ncbi:MAG: amidohydrolase family protein [Gemmatimonadales bacterium]